VGTLGVYPAYAVIAAFAVIVTVGYLLWMLRRVAFGPLNPDRAEMPDLSVTEALSMSPLCLLILVVGLFPQTLIAVISPSVQVIMRALGQ
jgi:NADH-quinone oxidoreductase subunit M